MLAGAFEQRHPQKRKHDQQVAPFKTLNMRRVNLHYPIEKSKKAKYLMKLPTKYGTIHSSRVAEGA